MRGLFAGSQYQRAVERVALELHEAFGAEAATEARRAASHSLDAGERAFCEAVASALHRHAMSGQG